MLGHLNISQELQGVYDCLMLTRWSDRREISALNMFKTIPLRIGKLHQAFPPSTWR